MNRAIWVAVGLVLAVALTIVWALTRFHATAIEDVRASVDEGQIPSTPVAAAEARSLADSLETAADEDAELSATPMRVASDRAPASSSRRTGTISLHGVVHDSRGGPLRVDEALSDVAPWIATPEERIIALVGPRGSKRRSTYDEEGQYSFTGLTAGEWEIHTIATGYRPWTGHVSFSDAESDRRFDIDMNPIEILNVLVEVDAGDAFSEFGAEKVSYLSWLVHDCEDQSTVRIVLTKEFQRGTLNVEARPDFDWGLGHGLEAKEGRNGTHEWVVRQSFAITGEPPMFVSVAVGDQVLECRRVISMKEDLTFSLTLGRIRACFGGVRFRVLDDQGRTLVPAVRAVLLYRPMGSGGGQVFYRDGWGCHDTSRDPGSSEVSMDSLHPGPLGIEIDYPPFAALKLETVVASGVVRDLGTFRLAIEREIRGSVVNADGSPAQVEVECAPLRSVAEGSSLFQPQFRPTDTPGRFAFYHVGPGRYAVRVRGGGQDLSAATIVSTEKGSVDGVKIQLQSPTEVQFKLDKPFDIPLRLAVEDNQGVVVEQIPMSMTDRRARALLYLVAGRYTASALQGDQLVASSSFVVGKEPMRIALNPP